jgi:hypothetical protein
MIENETQTEETVEAPVEAAPATPPAPTRPDPDPLVTPDLEMDEDERRWREAAAQGHARLTRKHKPPVTAARIAELESRREEVMALMKEQYEVRKKAEEGFEARVEELENAIARRTLKPYDQVVLRLYWQNGLLQEKDREALLAAEAKRARQAAKRNELAARGAYRASERAGEVARAYAAAHPELFATEPEAPATA